MTTHQLRLMILIGTFVCGTSSMRGEEILIHTGPPVSTPASTPVTPFPEKGIPKMIQFQREFFVDRDTLVRLPEPSSDQDTIPVSAIEAIELAKNHIDPQGGLRSWVVTELRLMKVSTSINRLIEYYYISAIVRGSEYHLIVLMDRKVITSKLRKINESEAQQAAPRNR